MRSDKKHQITELAVEIQTISAELINSDIHTSERLYEIGEKLIQLKNSMDE